MAQAGGPSSNKIGAWASVFLVVVAFVVGTIAVIAHNSVPLWIAAGVIMVVGGVIALASNIMDYAH